MGPNLPRIVFVEVLEGLGFINKFRESYQGFYHTHLMCQRGNISFKFNGKQLKCKSGEFLFWFADSKLEDLNCSDNFKADVLLVEKDFLMNNNPDQSWTIDSLLYSRENPIKKVSNEDKKRILLNFNQLYAKFNEVDHRFYEEVLKLQMQIFIFEMWHTFATMYERHKRSLQTGTMYERFIQLVEEYCIREREVKFYANRLHITPKYLNHICKSTTGITASVWINRYTKDRLIHLLGNRNINISEIADMMDFSSRSFFTRYVKKLLGVTPKQYRERFK